MKLGDIFRYSFGAIKTRKLRAFLTMLGIVIGIAAIVALNSLSGGFEQAISNQFQEGFSTNALGVLTTSNSFGSTSTDFKLYANDSEVIQSINHVSLVVPVIQKNVGVVEGGKTYTLALTGVDFEKYGEVYSTFIAEKGTIPTDPFASSFVIGHQIHQPWQNESIWADINENITVSWIQRNGTHIITANYTTSVAAVITEIGGINTMGGPSDRGIYLPINVMMNIFNTTEVTMILVLTDDDSATTIQSVTDTITSTFNNQVRVISASAVLSTIDNALNTITIFLSAIAAISLVVAGVGIMNIMIVSLLERVREIGILKALGSKDHTILFMFLLETFWIGLIGAIAGILLGVLLANVFGAIIGSAGSVGGITSAGIVGRGRLSRLTTSGITPVFTLELILEALGFGIGISLLFGLYPAWRASRLPPIEALRYE